jgi:hypothetical protein
MKIRFMNELMVFKLELPVDTMLIARKLDRIDSRNDVVEKLEFYSGYQKSSSEENAKMHLPRRI